MLLSLFFFIRKKNEFLSGLSSILNYIRNVLTTVRLQKENSVFENCPFPPIFPPPPLLINGQAIKMLRDLFRFDKCGKWKFLVITSSNREEKRLHT